MSERQWRRRVEEIFLEVVDRPALERRALIHRSCGDDESLREAVEAMVRREGRITADFLSGGGDRDATVASLLYLLASAGSIAGIVAVIRL